MASIIEGLRNSRVALIWGSCANLLCRFVISIKVTLLSVAVLSLGKNLLSKDLRLYGQKG